MPTTIEVIQGDITSLQVDVIVNAANNSLLGGGGVDGAIHTAAGPGLLRACMTLGGCATGNAKITQGYNLPARHIIHTVGPVWHGGKQREDELLASCYRCSLELAVQYNLLSIAFPAISTGAYRFPMERATRIALAEIRRFLADEPRIERILLVAFDAQSFALQSRILAEADAP